MKKIKLSREFKIGFFGILMLALLYWGINFIKGTDLFSGSRSYYAVYDNVSGLQKAGSVVVQGYKIGTVADMTLDPRRSDKVLIELLIKSKYRIPVDSEARIFSDGLMGGKAIEIRFGKEGTFLSPGDTIISTADKDLLEMAGSELEFFKQRISSVTGSLTSTLDMVTTILADNQRSISAMLANTAAATESLNGMIISNQGELQKTITNLSEFSATLNDRSAQLENILTDVEGLTSSLDSADVAGILADLSVTIGNLNTAISSINEGDGTLGLLLNDDRLYNELLRSSHDLSALLEDIKQNPRKYINLSFSLIGGGE